MSYVEISDESTETSKMLTDEQQQQQQQPSTPKRDSISSKTNEDSDLNVIVLDNIDSSIFDKFQVTLILNRRYLSLDKQAVTLNLTF